MMFEKTECEICAEDISLGDSVVRIAAEAAAEADVDSHTAIVFAIFHSACVVETINDFECDTVPYIEEAREIIENSSLCECCSDKMVPPEAPGLTLLRGGLV